MGLFNQLFGKNTGKEPEERAWETMSPEEKFVLRFTSNGGRFLLAETHEDASVFLNAVLQEENFEKYQTKSENLLKRYHHTVDMVLTNDIQPSLPLLSEVEFLIEENGGISLNSNQIGQIALERLPEVSVFVASPAQLVQTIEDAMVKINAKYPNKQYPSNIRSITHFNQDSKRFYLILDVELQAK